MLTKVLVHIKSLNLLHRGTIRWPQLNPTPNGRPEGNGHDEENGELELKCGAMYENLDDVYAVPQDDIVYRIINDIKPILCDKCFDVLDRTGYLRID